MDYYKVLGISKSASSEEIKKAFHKLAHKHHPHKGGDEKKFKEINEAYQILSNEEKRAQYDQFGQVFDGPGAGPGFDGSNWAWGKGFSGQGANVDFDLGDIGDIFEDFLGFQGRGSQKKDFKRGKNIRIDIEIPLKDVLDEIKKEITLKKNIVCSRCQGRGAEPNTNINECFSCRGTGQVQEIKKTFLGSFTKWGLCPECNGDGQKPEKPCNVCKGDGRVRGEENIKINIPAGVDSNQIIEIKEKGDAGKRGGQSGDLYIRFFVQRHPEVERRGDDLYTFYPISFSQAVLGDEVELLTLDNKKILLKVPPGTESGKMLKISGKGIPRFSGYGKGNLYIALIVKTPKKLNRKQKELLRKLQEEGI